MFLNLFDIVIAVICGVAAFSGVRKGMIGLLSKFSIFLLSIILTLIIFSIPKLLLQKYFNDEVFINIISGVISYLISLIICGMINRKIIKFVEEISGGIMDKTLGLILGALGGILISCVIFILVAVFATGSYLKAENAKQIWNNVTEKKYPKWLKNSVTVPFLSKSIENTIGILPQSWIDKSLKSIQIVNWHKPDNKALITKEDDVFHDYTSSKSDIEGLGLDNIYDDDYNDSELEKELIDLLK